MAKAHARRTTPSKGHTSPAPLAGLRGSTAFKTGPASAPSKRKVSADPLAGLKNAIKAYEVAKYAQYVAMLGGGG